MAIGNSINDEIREQQKKAMAELGPLGKIKYFIYYYKWHVIATVFALSMISLFVYEQVTKEEMVFQAVFVNSFPNMENEEFMAGFEEQLGLDTQKETAVLDTSIFINPDEPSSYDDENTQKLFVMASAQMIDVCVANEAYYNEMADAEYFADLSTILTEEQMKEYEDRLFYYDAPEDGIEGEVPVGIDVSDSPKIVESQSFPNTKAYFGIVVNTERIESSLAFLEYLDTP